MTLQDLMDLVTREWPFNEENYPLLKGCSDEEKKQFAIRHILIHMVKAHGQLAESVEPWDHGRNERNLGLCRAVGKLFKEILRLAEIAGITADQLISACIEDRS